MCKVPGVTGVTVQSVCLMFVIYGGVGCSDTFLTLRTTSGTMIVPRLAKLVTHSGTIVILVPAGDRAR